MQKIDIEGIINELRTELKIGEKKGYFTKTKEKDKKPFLTKYISYIELEKYMFNKISIDGTNIRIEGLDNIDAKWIYEANNKEINEIKNKFIEKIIEKIKFCPFCGKTPLILFNSDLQKDESFLEKILGKITVLKIEKGRLFDLDHIFPKSKDKRSKNLEVYPYLAINFYNLIPCCKGCNFIKSNKNFLSEISTKGKIFHPYFGWITKDGINNIHNKNKFDNSINLIKSFNSSHSKFFKLKEIYLNSQDTKNDILFIRDKIEKIKTDKMNLKNLGLINKFDLEERKDLFFKNYYPTKEQDILKFSNGKLKKDLIENLKI